MEEKTAKRPAEKSAWRKLRSKVVVGGSRYALQKNLLVFAYHFLQTYLLTLRIEFSNEQVIFKHLDEGNKMIAALWHQRIISVLRYARQLSPYRPSVMISRSRDGDLIADVFSRMQFRPVRGSSSRGGKQALHAMVDDLKVHPFAAIIPDGPRGPQGVIKPGLLVMAQQSAVPIIPLYVSASRAWQLNSWDKTLVPKPFSRMTFRWADPIYVPRDLNDAEFEKKRLEIETLMLENQRLDDSRFGWRNLI